MSYILEALKRADAERQRGAVPGLHASQVTTSLTGAAPVGHKRLVWVAATALVLSGMALGLLAWRMAAPTPAPVAQTAPVPAPTPVLAAALPSAPEPGSAQQITATPSPTTVAPVIDAPLPVAARPNPVGRPTPRVADTPAVTPVAPAVVTHGVEAQGPQTTAASVLLLSELPQDLRRQIPALIITGAVYSDNPAQRLLVVNNQVLTQGSVAAPEVNLDEIQPKSSVFSFRGTRFRVAH